MTSLRPRLFGLLLVGVVGCYPLNKNVRVWGSKQIPAYRKLVDEKYSDQDTRRNSYRAMASLICSADEDDKHPNSAACQCHRATSDDDADKKCEAFFEGLSH